MGRAGHRANDQGPRHGDGRYVPWREAENNHSTCPGLWGSRKRWEKATGDLNVHVFLIILVPRWCRNDLQGQLNVCETVFMTLDAPLCSPFLFSQHFNWQSVTLGASGMNSQHATQFKGLCFNCCSDKANNLLTNLIYSTIPSKIIYT